MKALGRGGLRHARRGRLAVVPSAVIACDELVRALDGIRESAAPVHDLSLQGAVPILDLALEREWPVCLTGDLPSPANPPAARGYTECPFVQPPLSRGASNRRISLRDMTWRAAGHAKSRPEQSPW